MTEIPPPPPLDPTRRPEPPQTAFPSHGFDEPDRTRDVAKDEATTVASDAKDSAQQVASTTKEQAAEVTQEAKTQARASTTRPRARSVSRPPTSRHGPRAGCRRSLTS